MSKTSHKWALVGWITITCSVLSSCVPSQQKNTQAANSDREQIHPAALATGEAFSKTLSLSLGDLQQPDTKDILFVVDQSEALKGAHPEWIQNLKVSIDQLTQESFFSKDTELGFLLNMVADPDNYHNLPPLYSADIHHKYYKSVDHMRKLPGFLSLISYSRLQDFNPGQDLATTAKKYCAKGWNTANQTTPLNGKDIYCSDLALIDDRLPYTYASSPIALAQFLDINRSSQVYRNGEVHVFMMDSKTPSMKKLNETLRSNNKIVFDALEEITPTDQQLLKKIKENSNPMQISIHRLSKDELGNVTLLKSFIKKSLDSQKKTKKYFSYKFDQSASDIKEIDFDGTKASDLSFHPRLKTVTFSLPVEQTMSSQQIDKNLTITFKE